MDKVLVAAPISQTKDYILNEYLENISSLDYPNYDIYLVDNSKDENFHKNIRAKGFDCDRIQRRGNVQQWIADSQNKIRERALIGGYDWLMSIECDVIAPKNIISWLLHYDKPIVGTTYYVDYSSTSKDREQLPGFCWQDMDNYLYRCIPLINPITAFNRTDGDIHQCFSPGLGCTLIHRYVLEEVEFRSEMNNDESALGFVFSDTTFFMDCWKKQIQTYIDTSMYVEHHYQSWEKNKDLCL